MSLAVHIDRNLRLRKTTEEWPDTLDYRWEKDETAEFVEKLRQFAVETKFDEFFKGQSGIYEEGMRPMRQAVIVTFYFDRIESKNRPDSFFIHRHYLSATSYRISRRMEKTRRGDEPAELSPECHRVIS